MTRTDLYGIEEHLKVQLDPPMPRTDLYGIEEHLKVQLDQLSTLIHVPG